MSREEREEICFIVDERQDLLPNRTEKGRVELRINSALGAITAERELYVEIEDFRSRTQYEGKFTNQSITSNKNNLSVFNISEILKLLKNFHYRNLEENIRNDTVLEYKTFYHK